LFKRIISFYDTPQEQGCGNHDHRNIHERRPRRSMTEGRRSYTRATEAERREDLILATLDCIAESGIQGATVRQIANRAGVTGGLIRHYFSGKDQMLQEAYRKVMTGMSEIAIAAADLGNTPRARLQRFIVANVTPPITDPRTLSLWAAFISHIQTDASFAAIHRDSYLAFLQALEGLLTAFFREEGRKVSPAECRGFAIALNALVDGLWLEGTLAADMFGERELADVALSAVEALLRLPPGHLSADAIPDTSAPEAL
jgi:AcrR family transcriptional regulator